VLPGTDDRRSKPEAPVTDAEATMSLLEHLEELRRRLIITIAAVVIGAIIGFFLSDPALQVLRAPLPAQYDHLIFTRVTEIFELRLKIGIFIGIALAMPVILYQVWRFVSPGLTTRERHAIWPLLLAALLLFALGVEVGYVIIPFALAFLLGLAPAGIPALLTVGEYVGFVTTMMLAFGLVMEFPIVLVALSRVGLLSYRRVAAQRRLIILGIVIFAVVVTPGGDPFSPSILSAVMYLLFEGSLLVMRLAGR
jgi:sec-independent protein translocase protein TatC